MQIFFCDIAGHIFTREARGIKFGNARIVMPHRTNQAVQILVDQSISADQFLNFLHAATICDELGGCGHVYSVDVRIANRRRSGCEVHLAGPSFARQFDDLLRCRATHDRVIHQQYVLAAELEVDSIQFAAHGLRSFRLSRHDERAADVAVLDKAFAILDTKVIGHLQRGRAAGIGYRNDNIDVVFGKIAHDFASQLFAHSQARFVDRQIIENRVRAREIDVFEDARCVAHLMRVIAAMQLTVIFDKDTFAGPHIP